MVKLKKTATQTMKDLLAEQAKIHAGYDKAIQVAQDEYNQLEKEFHEIEAEVREAHKNYVLNIITNEAYLLEKKRLKDADEKLRDAGYKLNEINTYRTEDLRDLLTRMEEVAGDYGREKVASETKMRYKALNAKYEYLKSIRELAKEHGEVFSVSREVEDLRVQLGVKKYNYISFEDSFKKLLGDNYSGTEGVEITMAELEQAFYRGTINKQFIDEIEKGKQAGFIQ